MADHGSPEKGINWADRLIDYKDLHTVVTEAVAGFAHLYAYGVSNVTFLSSLTGRMIHNLGDMVVPPQIPSTINTDVPCRPTNFPNLLARKDGTFLL
jgi:hypothetical protein